MADFKKIIYFGFVIAFIGLLFYLGPGNILQHKLDHPFPYPYQASDAFVHLSYMRHLHDSGSWKYYGPEISQGFDDVLAFNPPFYYIMSDLIQRSSGFEMHNVLIFLSFFFTISAIYLLLYLISEFDMGLSLIVLPFSLFFFLGDAFTLFTWGTWPFILGSVFLIAVFVTIKNHKLLPFMLAGAALSHTSEYIFAIGFVGFYVLVNKFKDWLKYAVSVFISAIFSIYYLFVFKGTWMVVTPYEFKLQPASSYTGIIFPGFDNFIFLEYFIKAGILFVSLYILFYLFAKKKIHHTILANLYILLVSFTNWIGFGLRAFQTRLFWPIYLAFYSIFIVSLFKSKTLKFYLSLLLCLILTGYLLIFAPFASPQAQIMSDDKWDLFNAVKALPIEEKVLFLYDPVFDQTAQLFILGRRPFITFRESMYKKISENSFTPNQTIYYLGEGKSNYAYLDGLSFKYHLDEVGTVLKDESICDYDYWVVDLLVEGTLSNHDNYKYALIDTLLKQKTGSIIFKNDHYMIIKNMGGGDCFEEKPLSELKYS